MRTTEEKTIVFQPLTEADSRSVPEEKTKDVPLVADRFAGRYWDGHEEESRKPEKTKKRKKHLVSVLAIAAVLLLFTGAVIKGAFSGSETNVSPIESSYADGYETASDAESETSDSVTVLHVRRGEAMKKAWDSVTDFIADLF